MSQTPTQTLTSEESVPPAQKPAKKSLARTIFDYLVGQWFIFGLGLAIGLAAAFPKVGMNDGPLKTQWTVKYGCIAIIFLITGLSISTDALIKQAKNFKLHLVTQVTSFLGFSAVIYAIVACIKASGTTKIDPVAMAGLILMGVLPTTIASNIAMTRNAGGNVEAATAEVCVGNTLGTFLTPLLLSMYLRPSDGWEFIQPRAESGNGLVAIYKHMGRQLGATLFAPLILGQIVQNLFRTQTKKYREMFRLNYIGQVLLLIIIWSTFCNKFASGAFHAISHESVILICFLGVGMYAGFTGVCLFITRVPFIGPPPPSPESEPRWKRALRRFRFSKVDATAVCFCAAAKGLVLGAPLISILYGGYDEETQAIMTIPIALYQGTQIALAQLSTRIFKKWISIPDTDEDGSLDSEKRDCRQENPGTGGGDTPKESPHKIV